MPHYRAAIIGTGRIASLLEQDPLRSKPHTHAGWYRAHPDIELVAGADINAQRLEAFGRDWQIPAAHLYTDYRIMLDQIRPDIVSVCAYAPQRLEMVEASIRAGARGLWIEKAIACSLNEAVMLERLLEESGVSAIVDHPRRTNAAYRAVRRIIVEKTFGAPKSITCLMSGDLIHTGSHAYDMLHFWCGDMLGAMGWLETEVPPEGPLRDCGGKGILFFSNGVQAFIAGDTKDYYVFQFDLMFSRARIQIGNDVLKVLRPAPSKLYAGFEELFEAPDYPLRDPLPWPMIYDLTRAIETQEQPVMSVANAVAAFGMGLALFQSHREGHRFITPAELDPNLRIESV